jgi:2-keto-4-pentenoate hydratase
MTIESDLVRRLSDAQRNGSQTVDATALAEVDRAAVYRIQKAVMGAIGERAGMYKVWTNATGDAAIAPIYASRVGDSGTLRLASATVTGLEVEVGVVLARDLPAGSDRATVDAALGRYFMGIEICGTRFADRSKAGVEAGFADNMSAFGYAFDTRDWEHGAVADGKELILTFKGNPIWVGPARHGFGGVLNAVYAYAALRERPYPLMAGTILTTGSLCGLVPTKGPGKGVARMGGHAVEVELT